MKVLGLCTLLEALEKKQTQSPFSGSLIQFLTIARLRSLVPEWLSARGQSLLLDAAFLPFHAFQKLLEASPQSFHMEVLSQSHHRCFKTFSELGVFHSSVSSLRMFSTDMIRLGPTR